MFDLPPVSELPSGSSPEFGRHRVAEYAFKVGNPCEHYQCQNMERCKDKMLACSSFRHFVSTPNATKLRPPTTPSRQIFDQIFNEQDEN